MMIGVSAPAWATVCYTPDPVDGMDTWFGSFYNTTGMANSDQIRLGGWGDEYDSLLRFNLSGLPVSATQAALYLYAFPSGTPTTINWWRPNVNWQEATAGWNKDSTVSEYLGTTAAPTPNAWYGINITNLYNQWRTGSALYPNRGLKMSPVNTNNTVNSFYSSDYVGNTGLRPWICVDIALVENRIVLKWPLATSKPATPSLGFGGPWGTGQTKCVGLPMSHAGVDIPNAIGNPVYAAEDGFVREIFPANQSGGWASAIVIEHNHPNRAGKYTTVYWHVNPLPNIVVSTNAQSPTFIPKGMQIATIADLSARGAGSHLHLGVRIGAYDGTYSDKGALPTGYCSELTTFPEKFIDPWNTNLVLFQ